ncbi:MAG: hypothetical protein EPO55_25760 [Reyranella sp.]|uniref:hypothetical protein n=1 Tax=Reyranella sp. TaxID=1929291 RepID=UPI0012206488|nr:hypothetical protein [Reyranella sp.]TAJ35380.1 MAG: hypothetical protein EPO55_25760 [Reyranella sp.]
MTSHELLVQIAAYIGAAVAISYAMFGPWWRRFKLEPSHLIWVGLIGTICSVLILTAGIVWQARQQVVAGVPPALSGPAAAAPPKVYFSYDIERQLRAIDQLRDLVGPQARALSDEGRGIYTKIDSGVQLGTLEGSTAAVLTDYAARVEALLKQMQALAGKYSGYEFIREFENFNAFNPFEVVSSARNVAAALQRGPAGMAGIRDNQYFVAFGRSTIQLGNWSGDWANKLDALRKEVLALPVTPSAPSPLDRHSAEPPKAKDYFPAEKQRLSQLLAETSERLNKEGLDAVQAPWIRHVWTDRTNLQIDELISQIEGTRELVTKLQTDIWDKTVLQNQKYRDELLEVVGLQSGDTPLNNFQGAMGHFLTNVRTYKERREKLADEDRYWTANMILNREIQDAVMPAANAFHAWITTCNQKIDAQRAILK